VNKAILAAACLLLLAASTASADDTLWTRRFNGPGNRDDAARKVFVDAQDNVIAVGSCIGIGTGNDIVAVEYDADGTLLWSTTIAGAGASNDDAKGAAADSATRAIYITSTTGIYPDYNIMTVKLDATGTEVWRHVYEGPSGLADVPAGIAVDASGDAYVTGYATDTSGLTGWVVMKLSSINGLQLWAVVRPGESGGIACPTAIALGPGTNPDVYVTGFSAGEHLDDYCTVKYDNSGVKQWASYYNYAGNGSDRTTAIAVDASGNAYVTGRSATQPPPSGVYQYATVEYAGDSGTQLWVARYAGEGGNNVPAGIALGASTGYVTGSSQNASSDNDYATVAYNLGTGSQQWATRDNGPDGKADDPVGIAVSPAGKIIVTGTSVDWSDKGDFLTLRYAEDGTREWASRFNGEIDGDDQAASLAIDSHSNPIVLGTSYGPENYDLLIVKYDGTAVGGIIESGLVVPARPVLRLAPNPARNWTSVEHSLSSNAPALVSLLGVDGRVVYTQRLGTAGPARLDLTGLAPGVYLVRLESGGHSATQKLVIQH
jgi:hypothetical protein